MLFDNDDRQAIQNIILDLEEFSMGKKQALIPINYVYALAKVLSNIAEREILLHHSNLIAENTDEE